MDEELFGALRAKLTQLAELTGHLDAQQGPLPAVIKRDGDSVGDVVERFEEMERERAQRGHPAVVRETIALQAELWTILNQHRATWLDLEERLWPDTCAKYGWTHPPRAGSLLAELHHRVDNVVRPADVGHAGALLHDVWLDTSDQRAAANATKAQSATGPLQSASHAALADVSSRREGTRASRDNIQVRFRPDGRQALVRFGQQSAEMKGKRRVWLFRSVYEAHGDIVAWGDLLRGDWDRAAKRIEALGTTGKRKRTPRTPRFAAATGTLQRLGRHVKASLGELGYYWHQDGHGARWALQTPSDSILTGGQVADT